MRDNRTTQPERHQVLFWPFSIIFMGMLLIGMALSQPTATPLAAPGLQAYPTSTTTSYPTPTKTPKAQDNADPTNTPTVGTTPEETQTTPPEQTPTSTKTRVAQTPTLTNTPQPEEDVRDCPGGIPVIIEGTKAPPEVALSLYFGRKRTGDRSRIGTPEKDFDIVYQVVGGGISDSTGHFVLRLVVGKEKPGSYPVKIQVRGSKKVVYEFTCLVDIATPTPTPGGSDET